MLAHHLIKDAVLRTARAVVRRKATHGPRTQRVTCRPSARAVYVEKPMQSARITQNARRAIAVKYAEIAMPTPCSRQEMLAGLP
jgi:hypothetical protein